MGLYYNGKKITSITKVKVVNNSIAQVETSEEMNALLVSENIGKIYQYTGVTNDTYTNGELYQVVEEV